MTASTQPHIGKSEFRAGWPIILCGLIGVALSNTNLSIYTIGQTAPALSKAFGWELSMVQAHALPSTLALVLAMPLVGTLVDRYGPRLIGIASAALLSVAMLLHVTLQGSIIQFYLLSVLVALAGAGTIAVTWSRMITLWFVRRRGLALGIMLLGTGLGGALLKPITAALIANWGWKGAYVGLGLLPLLFTVPLCLLLFRAPPVSAEAAQVGPASESQSMGEALHDWRFWAMGFAMIPVSLVIGAMIANMETILGDMGFGPDQAVMMASFIGISVIVGRLLGGWLLDKMNAGLLGAILILLMAAGCLAMAQPQPGFVLAMAGIASVGLCSGVEFDVIAFLTARMFGLKAYARIYSAILMFYFAAGATGPFLFSRAREIHSSFGLALSVSAAALVGAAALMLAVGLSKRRAYAAAH